jgi:phage/plasmid-like protein (TIGR03299 family)
MLGEANLLNWNIFLRVLESDARRSKEDYEAVRTNPFDGGLDRLGVHGERYHIVQNEEAFAMFDGLEPQWEAAGSFNDGKIVYGQARTGKSIVIDPNGAADEVQPLINVTTSHDGSGALRIGRTGLRLDCYNQWNFMLKGLTDSVSVRHTRSVQDRMRAIKLAWKENNLYFDALSEEANRLYAQSVTDAQFFAIVGQKAFAGERPELNTKGAQTKWDNNMELYAQAWRGEPNAKAYGTAWGVFNALTERNQWGRTIQNTANGLDNFAKAGMGLDGPTNVFRQRAWDAAQSLVTV